MSEAQLGQLLALLSAVSFACGNVFVSKGAAGGGDRGVLFSVLVTAVFSGALWLVTEGGSLGAGGGGDWWNGVFWFAFAGVLAMVFGRTFLFASIRHLGVTRASAVKRLNPFFSVLLAFVFLAEPITGLDGLGMVAIAAAFFLLLRSTDAPRVERHDTRISPVDYAWGVGSAFAYAGAYVARKYGLGDIGSPAFGTLVSALSGFAFFTIAGLFASRYRDNLRNIFSNLNRWRIFAAIAISCGQILLFAALFYEKVSTVVMIASMEVFISSFLSVVVFRAERRPDTATYVAAVLATAGVLAVAAG